MADIMTRENRKFWAKSFGRMDPPRFRINPKFYVARELWLAEAVFHRNLVRYQGIADRYERDAVKVEWLCLDMTPRGGSF